MKIKDYLVRKFKDETAAIYTIERESDASSLHRYIVSTRDTRNMMNFPEIINCDFTELMRNGITNALKSLNHLEKLSMINSRNVNVYHILRGGLNFQIRDVLRKAFGYKWHSSSYISSQRVKEGVQFVISEDAYRKFEVPNNATVYSADIVASGASLDNSLVYLEKYLEQKQLELKNFIFITIGGVRAEEVLEKWDKRFKQTHPHYERTVLIYLEGRFALGSTATPLANVLPDTDLLRNYKLGALLSPEFEHSQFEKIIIALEGCAIYDGGKKAFEPVNHIIDVLEFWEKQRDFAKKETVSLWQEYNARFPLDMYLRDKKETGIGTPELLKERKAPYWKGVSDDEYVRLFKRFTWLWTKERIASSKRPGSLRAVCEKKISYLNSLFKASV